MSGNDLCSKRESSAAQRGGGMKGSGEAGTCGLRRSSLYVKELLDAVRSDKTPSIPCDRQREQQRIFMFLIAVVFRLNNWDFRMKYEGSFYNAAKHIGRLVVF
jgi:hypothetical protein